MIVEIDSRSGFCYGVVTAIRKCEQELKHGTPLYCLGDIVHNGAEVRRLESQGLITISYEQLAELKQARVLFRAHGEPPSTYQLAQANGIEVVDASCPVVLKLQERIRAGYKEVKALGGQVVIFGKSGHAEVNGLLGQTEGQAVVVGSIEDLETVDFDQRVYLYSQTTQNPRDYELLIREVGRRFVLAGHDPETMLKSHKTICGQVSRREREIGEFARRHEVVVFVSGKKSSNGRALFEICRQANANTFFVSGIEEIDTAWFLGVASCGVSGATSTPKWLMEEVRAFLQDAFPECDSR